MSAVSTITEQRQRRREDLLRACLEELLPVRGGHYVVKPNISSCRPSSSGATTDTDLVRVVVRHLQDHGAQVSLVELPPHVRNVARVMSLTGFRTLARELDIRLVIPDSHREFVAPGRLFRVFPCRVARAAWESDGIVNLPKVKTHDQAHFSAAVKNLMGLADGTTRHRMHVYGLHRGIAELHQVLEPAIVLNVLDAVIAMHGQGPTRGDPLPLDTLLVGRDAVACDLQAARATGIALDRVPYLKRLSTGRPSHGVSGDTGVLTTMVPAHASRRPKIAYVRSALITQPVLRRLMQRLDTDFITNRRPVIPAGKDPLDQLCPYGAIRDRELNLERCSLCHECVRPGSPVELEGGQQYRARVARELLSVRRR